MRNMDYTDFYSIAEYGNTNWKGGFSPREVAENAFDYWAEYDADGLASHTIQELLALLMTDGSAEALEWADRIKEGRKL